MSARKDTPTLQDILRKRQQSEFVGRTQQVADFRANLRYDVTDERRKFIFSISGQGGVGKTWLARRLRKIAEEFGALTALTDEAETDVPSAMGRIAEQLDDQGYPLKAFSERYKVYRQRKQELEADPDAPQGLTAFVTRTMVDVGFDLLEQTPAGVITKRLPKEMLANQASEWAEFVRKKLANKDETRLVLEPIPVLTPLWLDGLAEIAQEPPLALFFDTYERTCTHLDPWLREMLDGRHGTVPATIVWSISGRDALDDNDWAQYRGLMAAAALEPFSEDEVREYLSGKGITDPKIVEVILRLSGRLPLLVATLATQSPSDAEDIEDPSDTAVERFLKWVNDPVQRHAALYGALPRLLNQDILACVVDATDAEQHFAWLQTMPFVQKRGVHWEYHEVVRSAMLRYLRAQSPRTWANLHRRLAEQYEMARDGLGLDEERGRKDSAWQELALEALYHRLCQAPKANLPAAINGFLTAWKAKQAFSRRWSEILSQAGEDTSAIECAMWGTHLLSGVTAYEDDHYDAAIAMFTAILEYPALELAMRSVALDWRGYLHCQADHYDPAITDLSEAIRLAPEVAEYWGDRGVANLWKLEYAAALADFDRAIVLDADNASMLARRGETYRRMGEYAKAVPDFDRAIALIPDETAYLSSRSLTYAALGRYADALADIQRAITIASQEPNLRAWEMFLQVQTGEWGRAAETASTLTSQTSELISLQQAALHKLPPEMALQGLQSFFSSLGLDVQTAHMQASRWLATMTGEPEAAVRTLEAELAGVQGLGHSRAGETTAALTDFAYAIELDPGNAGLLVRRGAIHQQLGQYEVALADFDRAIALIPDETAYLLSRSVTYAALGRYADALADIQRAITIAPQEPNLRAWEMFLQVQTGEWGRAAETASTLMSQTSELISLQQAALHKLPPEMALQGLQSFFSSLGLDVQTAHMQASRWLATMTGEPEAAVRTLEAELAGLQGLGHSRGGQAVEALTDFTHAIELDPGNAGLLVRRGAIHQQLGQYEAALADFDRAIELDPGGAGAIALRGKTYRQMGEYVKAIPDFDRAIALEPDDSDIIANRGATYRQMGEYAKALPDFDRAIALDADYTWAIASRGETYREMGEYEKALTDFGRAIGIEPDYAWAIARRGDTLEAMKLYDEAIDVYARAVELKPSNPYYHNNLAGVYLTCGRLEEAAAEYGKRIELSPDDALNAHVSLGVLLWRQDQLGEARDHFESALAVWGSTRTAQINTPVGLLENRAIALLCLGNQRGAFATLNEAFAATQPGDKFDADQERYALLASAPRPPDGLGQFLELIRVEAHKRAPTDQTQ